MYKENGDNLLILCSNGDLSIFEFTNFSRLDATFRIGSASNPIPCQTTKLEYLYDYDSSQNLIKIRLLGTVSGNEHTSEIIEMTENTFKTKYLGGNASMLTTVPNHITEYERIQ